jgi:hypothetical protein
VEEEVGRLSSYSEGANKPTANFFGE